MQRVTTVAAGQSPRRLDVFVSTQTALRIRPGDVITCHVAVRGPPPVEPEPLALHVLYDKGTSGVLVIAKTDAAHRDLSRQFRAHSVHRVYLALVAGAVRRGGLIDRALRRDTRDRRRVPARSVAPRRAVTEFRVAERLGPDGTLVEARPRTGRMHQIRVYLASIGHAVLGDASYGAAPADPTLARPMLHAAVLGFVHPATGEYTESDAPMPADMEGAVARHRGS